MRAFENSGRVHRVFGELILRFARVIPSLINGSLITLFPFRGKISTFYIYIEHDKEQDAKG